MAEEEAPEPQQESTIRPIPPGATPLGSLGNVRPEQDPEEPEDEVPEEPAPYVFAGRTWKSQAHAEAAMASMRGRENPKDQRINALEREIEKRDAQMDVLLRAKDRAVEDAPTTKAEKVEVNRFLQTLTKEQVEEFNDLRDAKGDAYAFSWLLNNYDSFQGGRIEKLEKALKDLKRTAIDEPNEMNKASDEWSSNIIDIAEQAAIQAAEGTGPLAEAYAQVFDPSMSKAGHIKNLDEVHSIMLDPKMHLEDTPEGFTAAVLMWVGYNSLESVRSGSSPQRGRRQASESRGSDPTVSSNRAGSRPRKSEAEPSYLSQPSRAGVLGKL